MADKQHIIKVRTAQERGQTRLDWLESYHTFSFGEYMDPDHMGYRTLRVINDDTIAAGGGFGTHPHKDMEIISYVMEGRLEHKDSMGHGSVIEQGNFQKMSAGTGVRHSEFNPSSTDRTRLLQIWILPQDRGLPPSYQELDARRRQAQEGLTVIASGRDEEGVIRIYQDVVLLRGRLSAGKSCSYPLEPERGLWVHVMTGEVGTGTVRLSPGDGASIEGADEIVFRGEDEENEFLLFDLK